MKWQKSGTILGDDFYHEYQYETWSVKAYILGEYNVYKSKENYPGSA